MSSQNISLKNHKKSSKEIIFKVLRQISYTKLFKKYTSGKFSFSKISINHLIYSDTCEIVARFKDFLIYDDNTEFIRRFYPGSESFPRLKKILAFYETYSKIFPNYLVLKENKYLYRNIRKKQKMINAINEIRKEEKENKKKLGIKNEKDDGNFKKNELFTKQIKDEIKIFQKNLAGKIYKNSFDTDNQNDEETLLINNNSISISILNWKEFEKNNFDKLKEKDNNIDSNSFITNKTDESITKMLSILNDNKIYIQDLPKIFLENKIMNIYPKKKKQNIIINKKIINNDKNKIKNNKNEISNYAKNSSNITTSSSLLSKKIQKKKLVSSENKTENDESKNNNYKINAKCKKIIFKKNTNNNMNKNINNKLYQPMSPQLRGLKYSAQFFYNNNNFKNKKSQSKKFADSEIKEKFLNNNENKEILSSSNNYEKIKKNSTKNKKKSEDMMTKNMITNNNERNFMTENNQNIITEEMENKAKKIGKNKVHVNLRDRIKPYKNKKIFHTAKKESNKGGLMLNFRKNKTNFNILAKKLKYYKNKSQKNIYSLANLNCNKYKFNSYRNNIDNSIPEQKTQEKNKNKNKKYLTKENKSETKSIFSKEKKELTNIMESNNQCPFNAKMDILKKKSKISNLEKNNLIINTNKTINTLQNKNSEAFEIYENKSANEKQLTPLKKRKLDVKSNNFSSKIINIKNQNKRVKTVSNEERPYKLKTFLNGKIRNKSNNNSSKNFILLNRTKSMKNCKNNAIVNSNRDKLFKTPDVNEEKMKTFKKNKTITNNKFNNIKIIKDKRKSKEKTIYSHTIKVNKTYMKKKNNKNLFKEKSKSKEKNISIN